MSVEDVFNSAVTREFRFLMDNFGFIRSNGTTLDNWGNVRHRYESGDWFITPVYNTPEKTINVEFGNADFVDEPLTLHLYMRLVDPIAYYKLGFGIAHRESDILPLLRLYAESLRTSGSAILRRDHTVCSRLIQAMKLGEGMCPSYGKQPQRPKIVSPYV